MSDVLTEQRGPARWIVMSRPVRRNALTLAVIDALHAALRSCLIDDDVRAIVLAGSRPAFSAGLDLHEVRALHAGNDRPHPLVAALVDLLHDVQTGGKPVIACVAGVAAAGGAALSAACDVVVAGRSARIGYPGIRRGLSAPIVGHVLIPQVGLRRAKYLVLTGRLLGAEEALRLGLVDEVVDDERLEERVTQIAESLAELNPAAVAASKRMLNAAAAAPGRSPATPGSSTAALGGSALVRGNSAAAPGRGGDSSSPSGPQGLRLWLSSLRHEP